MSIISTRPIPPTNKSNDITSTRRLHHQRRQATPTTSDVKKQTKSHIETHISRITHHELVFNMRIPSIKAVLNSGVCLGITSLTNSSPEIAARNASLSPFVRQRRYDISTGKVSFAWSVGFHVRFLFGVGFITNGVLNWYRERSTRLPS